MLSAFGVEHGEVAKGFVGDVGRATGHSVRATGEALSEHGWRKTSLPQLYAGNRLMTSGHKMHENARRTGTAVLGTTAGGAGYGAQRKKSRRTS